MTKSNSSEAPVSRANFFFWGIVSDEEAAEMWKVLHDHFEKLARQDDDGVEKEPKK